MGYDFLDPDAGVVHARRGARCGADPNGLLLAPAQELRRDETGLDGPVRARGGPARLTATAAACGTAASTAPTARGNGPATGFRARPWPVRHATAHAGASAHRTGRLRASPESRPDLRSGSRALFASGRVEARQAQAGRMLRPDRSGRSAERATGRHPNAVAHCRARPRRPADGRATSPSSENRPPAVPCRNSN